MSESPRRDPETETLGLETQAVRLPRATLLVVEGSGSGLRTEFDHRGLVIGSGPDALLRLEDPGVSRSHARVVLTAEGPNLKDLGSKNGTFLNGNRIREAFLTPGDTIQVGRSRLQFEPRMEAVQIPPSENCEFGDAFGRCLPMRQVFGILERAAPTDSTILIQGETGTGKEVIARSIHERSLRSGRRFQVFDCSAIDPNLVAADLFGYRKGAFTGAGRDHPGVFVEAEGGTLFLDEIGELPSDVQPKLLRALESREIRPLGSMDGLATDVRVLAATHRDLEAAVREGTFREDLYYRLGVIRVDLPALRERREDLGELVSRLAHHLCPGRPRTFAPETLRILEGLSWAGNVRELRNVIERTLTLIDEDPILPQHLLISSRPRETSSPTENTGFEDKTLEQMEREVINRSLRRHGGNRSEVARVLGIHRNTLLRKIRQFGLE